MRSNGCTDCDWGCAGLRHQQFGGHSQGAAGNARLKRRLFEPFARRAPPACFGRWHRSCWHDRPLVSAISAARHTPVNWQSTGVPCKAWSGDSRAAMKTSDFEDVPRTCCSTFLRETNSTRFNAVYRKSTLPVVRLERIVHFLAKKTLTKQRPTTEVSRIPPVRMPPASELDAARKANVRYVWT